MCLIVTNIVNPESARVASDLEIGTWFRDDEKQIYVVVNDAQSNSPTVVCVGSYFRPFIIQIPTDEIQVSDILNIGSVLQVSKDYEGGF